MYCITVLRLHILVLWLLQLLLLSGDVETNPLPVCQKCLADTCICNVKVKPRRRPSKRCPACASPVPCRRMICECGYDFIKCVIGHTPDKASKRKANRNAVAASRTNATPEQSFERKSNNMNAVATSRANATPEQSFERKSKNMNAMATSRANETPEESLKRRKQSISSMIKLREHQLPEVSARQNLNAKFRMKLLRLNDSVESSNKRATQSRLCMQRNRHKLLSIDEAMLAFHAKIKEGPDYVCTVCHRMMYRVGVVMYSRDNYCKSDPSILELVYSFEYVCADGRQWTCRTCNVHLKRGSLPVQAKANGLTLPNVPNELCDLKPLELRLVCMRVPFMKLVALPTGKQRCIHGPAVNVPSKLDSLSNLLPRLPSQTELVPLKLKRKLRFKCHYMYDNVCPDKLTKALFWLKLLISIGLTILLRIMLICLLV